MFFKILIFSDVPYSRGGSLLYSPTWITAEEICAAEPVLEYVRPNQSMPHISVSHCREVNRQT